MRETVNLGDSAQVVSVRGDDDHRSFRDCKVIINLPRDTNRLFGQWNDIIF